MKIPAIALAVVLSAASLWGQALVGYAGASATSGTAAAGSASKVGDSGMGGLHRKMSAAMGDTSTAGKSQGTNTQTPVHSAPADSRMQCKEMKSDAHAMSGKQCKEMHGTAGTKAGCCRKSKDGKMAHEMDCCKHGNCAHEKKRTGTEGAGKEASGKQTTQNQELKITFVGAK